MNAGPAGGPASFEAEISDGNSMEEGAFRREKPSRERNSKRVMEYERIAEGRGMGAMEFSRWVLAASPSERQQVLAEYYKRKRKKRKGTLE